MSKLICPNCGSEVVLPETSQLVTGITLSEQGNDVHYLNMKENKSMGIIENSINKTNKENKTMVDSRIETLNNNGINTNKYFSFQLPNGKTITVDENGIPVSDEIINKIEDDGFIENKTLYRRWVMAQFFRMYNYDLNKACAKLTQHYQWKMLKNELSTLAKLESKDSEYFYERSSFFTKYVIVKICAEYLDALSKYIDTFPVKYCCLENENGDKQRIPYKKIYGKNVFVSQIDDKVYKKYTNIIKLIDASKNYTQLSRHLNEFASIVHHLPNDFKGAVSPTWIDTYKGAGAYYTLQNMVLYHDCKLLKYNNRYELRNEKEYLKGNDAYNFMKDNLRNYYNYQWVGMFKQCVKDNNFTFGKKPEYFYKY